MTITISSDDPRSIKAIQIAAGASQWLKCHAPDGRKAYGVPSQCTPGRYYLVTTETCDCPDFQRHGIALATRTPAIWPRFQSSLLWLVMMGALVGSASLPRG